MRVKKDTRLYDINDEIERLCEEYDENKKSKAYHTRHANKIATLNKEFAETIKKIEKESKGF
jgi:hypothetical protein